MSFRFGFRRPKAATPFGILMLRAAKPPISAPSAAALRRVRSETRLRAQSFVAIFLPVFSDHWVYRQTEAGPVSGPACSDILLDGVDGALLQPAHLGLGDAHLGADLHLGLALVEPQGEDAPLPVVQPLHGLL